VNESAPDARLRTIPSVDRVLRELGETGLPRPVVLGVVRRELAAVRAEGGDGDVTVRVGAAVERLRRARLTPVVNATGVVLHTNLGRAPLGADVAAAVANAAENYTNLEFDLASGERGGRSEYVETALAALCETEAATVVNNCAAALVLAVRHFATGGRPEVVISRGELVQIGGGFRIPEILEAIGATLREVGTTNRTTLEDYGGAIGERTGMVLKVHRSNFHMAGFVESPTTAHLAELARGRGVPLVEDLGSGAMAPLPAIPGAADEPTVQSVVRAGADLVLFSGDKLFGGPQAGVIAGRAGHVAALKKEPLFRALRCDKLILAALQATVDLHLAGEGGAIPALAMTAVSIDELRARAGRIVDALAPARLAVVDTEARVGGGTLPQTTIPSVAVEAPGVLAAALRAHAPPVIGYVTGDRLRLDLRTVFPRQDEVLIRALRAAMGDGE
jgi:L-seryl-tRNA(Ser) seleniumtransferase